MRVAVAGGTGLTGRLVSEVLRWAWYDSVVLARARVGDMFLLVGWGDVLD